MLKLFYMLSLLPLRLLYVLADFEYLLLYYVFRYRRSTVRRNLTSSFPEKSEKEIRSIERDFYRWFADYFFEALKLLSISDIELRRRFRTGRTVLSRGPKRGGHFGTLLQLGMAFVRGNRPR